MTNSLRRIFCVWIAFLIPVLGYSENSITFRSESGQEYDVYVSDGLDAIPLLQDKQSKIIFYQGDQRTSADLVKLKYVGRTPFEFAPTTETFLFSLDGTGKLQKITGQVSEVVIKENRTLNGLSATLIGTGFLVGFATVAPAIGELFSKSSGLGYSTAFGIAVSTFFLGVLGDQLSKLNIEER